ncbi:MAG: hypothetical protein ACI8Z1_001781 [Candidatus Azotimanducaceae bacterium]|jgi:hypothetical protein
MIKITLVRWVIFLTMGVLSPPVLQLLSSQELGVSGLA